MCGTIVVRSLLFPLVILAQRNAAKMGNNMPQMQALQLKMSEARSTGNHFESARLAQEMYTFMKEKNLSPFKSMLVPLAQAPVFISFFMGLRQMANAPVESMREGGLFWFMDLTMPDQFYLLPIITSATLYITILVGTDAARMSQQSSQTLKYVLRAMPIVIFPFTVNFPGAILCYWACSNFISLIQVGLEKVHLGRSFNRFSLRRWSYRLAFWEYQRYETSSKSNGRSFTIRKICPSSPNRSCKDSKSVRLKCRYDRHTNSLTLTFVWINCSPHQYEDHQRTGWTGTNRCDTIPTSWLWTTGKNIQIWPDQNPENANGPRLSHSRAEKTIKTNNNNNRHVPNENRIFI